MPIPSLERDGLVEFQRNGESPVSSNRLAAETSPYLLQHAQNPVDWHPWDDQALELAKTSRRPILLSIGYSACHWCHVMERESFENEAIAAYMNEHFVCIKVDREERPDLDKIYQTAHQLMSRRAGGWPLTIAMEPDHHVPFFAGTYFPDKPRYGAPSFPDVLARIVEYYQKNQGESLQQHIAAVKDTVSQLQTHGRHIDPGLPDRAAEDLKGAYDPSYGGFGAAPKFPHPTNLSFCLRYGAQESEPSESRRELSAMCMHTLDAMARGGLFDHLKGGFFRYSVDQRWCIPHFEKMLYDNSQLLFVYTDAYLASGADRYRSVAVSTGDWVMSEMQDPDGGYYSTLDADSEGEEGRYYVWTTDELSRILDGFEFSVVCYRYGLHGKGNFEGKWHLNIAEDLDVLGEATKSDPAHVKQALDAAHRKMLEVRDERVRPGCDTKILTSWNGLMIKAMAHAGRHLDRAEFLDSADRATEFIRRELWNGERLFATTRDGRTRLNAYLDDYVFLLDALLTQLEVRWRPDRLDWAVSLAEVVLEHFEDRENGGMFFTSDDHEQLLYRDRPAMDDATPSGNGIAARTLSRLGHLLGETRYLESAERILQNLSASMQRYPSGHGSLLEAQAEYHEPVEIVVLVTRQNNDKDWRSALHGYAPGRMALSIPSAELESLPGVLGSMRDHGEVTAYVCRGTQCSAPVSQLEDFLKLIGARNPVVTPTATRK